LPAKIARGEGIFSGRRRGFSDGSARDFASIPAGFSSKLRAFFRAASAGFSS
jgi:hypothetical protein